MPRGGLGKLYYEPSWTDGTAIPATPTWIEVDRAQDLSFAGSENDADASVRGSNFAMDGGGLKSGVISFNYRFEQKTEAVITGETMAIWDRLVDSWLNVTPLLFQHMTGPIATSAMKGWRMIMRVKQVSEQMPLGDSMVSEVILAPFPGRDDNGALIAPSRITVA